MSTDQPTTTRASSAAPARGERARATTRAGKAKRPRDPESKRRLIKVLALVAVAFAMLYRPARGLYIAWRTGYTLESRREALAEENRELEEEVEQLMTREGIEDAARKHGYVMPGETSVKVEGLEEEPAPEPADETAQDLPWYIHVGDLFFFYGEDA